MADERSRDERDFETITPAAVELGATATTDGADGKDRRSPFLWVVLAVLLALGAAGVFMVLPTGPAPGDPTASDSDASQRASSSASSSDDATAERSPRPTAEQEEPPVPPWRQLRLERERKAAQDILADFVELEEQLAEHAVERWGADALQAARERAEAGDDAFLEQDYETAKARYREAVDGLETLLARKDKVRDAAVARGRKALEAGSSEAARDAFELALAIAPDHEPARVGLQRSRTLEQLNALLETAREQRRDDRLNAALATLQEARELDAHSERARTQLARVRAAIEERDYRRAMSRGYAALGDGQLDRAREAFRSALDIRGDSADAQEGLRMVEQATTEARINALQREAERLEAEERWSAAAERYAQALELDDTLAFARQGRRRAERRATLHERIDGVLSAPEQLRYREAYEDARALLERARAIGEPGPKLQEKRARLAEVVAVADDPVEVTLRSDGKTNVRVNQIGEFGTFEHRTVALKPGVYTAVGSRRGYRDVRQEFRVTPEGLAEPVYIATTEKI